jgi:excisionase family DNA binding protein
VLIDVLANMADCRPVSLVPIDSELSTQQAADLMNVSRPFFIKLLENGKLPYRKVGEQCRVLYQDLLRYISEYQKAAYKGLEELTTEAQSMGLYE